MWLLLLEAALALSLLVFIVLWTVWPKRKQLGQEMRRPPAGDVADVAGDSDPSRETNVTLTSAPASTSTRKPTLPRDQ